MGIEYLETHPVYERTSIVCTSYTVTLQFQQRTSLIPNAFKMKIYKAEQNFSHTLGLITFREPFILL